VIKKSLAAALSAALIILSAAPGLNAVAAEVASRPTVTAVPRVALPAQLPALPSLPAAAIPGLPAAGAGLSLPSALPQTATPRAADPRAADHPAPGHVDHLPKAPIAAARSAPQAAQRPIDRTIQALSAPSRIEAAAPAGADGSRGAAAEDFAGRIGASAGPAVSATEDFGYATEKSGLPALAHPATRAASAASAAPAAPAVAKSVPRDGEKRSAYFPLVTSVVAGLFALTTWAGSFLVPVASAAGQHAAPLALAAHAALTAVSVAGLGAAAVLAATAFVDAASFGVAMIKGRGKTNEDLARFLRAEAAAGRLDPGLAGIVRPYRPESWRDLTFGFASGGFIYVRPQLVATPAFLRLVLMHEHHHIRQLKARGPPPRGLLAGLWARARAEFSARAQELKGPGRVADARVPVLERALRQAQLSLQLDQPYELLVLNPGSKELNDPAVYKGLSGGAARIESVTTAEPQDVLGQAARKYRAVVMDQPSAHLPAGDTKDRRKLDLALRQLDTLYVLAERRMSVRETGFRPDSDEARRYAELVDKAQKLGKAPGRTAAQLDAQIKQMWRDISSTRLKGLKITTLVENLYNGLQNKGLAFMNFDAGDAGVETWEKLLRYWEGPDGGQFRVTRVDLESGGHIMVLRKLESRVGLWLSPLQGKTIKKSVPDANGSPERRAQARAALVEAGFESELAKFDELGVEISQVFGADVARQEIYVTVPRRNAAAIRKFVVNSGFDGIKHSEDAFQPQLMDAGTIHRVPQAWKIGVTGADETIMWIDTGGDASHEDFQGRLDRVDMVHEGPEDWIGHGTHVAGISISGGSPFTGMARAAKGIMAKVFGRDTPGAADGPIMGAGTIGLQKGVSVISASLGVKGDSGSNLALFFSQLTHQPNSKGEYVTVVASAGNSGPFDQTLSQPSAGADVLSVAAAAKSLDDKTPEIAFFSSAGPDIDPRFSIKRLRLAPKLTAIGGDVVTDPGDPNVYKNGVYSAKSKDMPPSYSDTADKRHTGMSGTSMAAPMAAGIALLVRSALRRSGSEKALAPEDVPLAVRAILMRTATDMRVPLWYQGAGLIDAWDAVKMAMSAAGETLRARLATWTGIKRLAPAPAKSAFDWIVRYKSVLELEDKAYQATELAKSQAQARFDETAGEDDGETPPEGRSAVGNAVAAEARKQFNAERDRALPALKDALKDPVWLVRLQAALTLLNLKSPDAAMELLEAALHDDDGRVRQMAFLALAELPTHSVDLMLQKASADPRWDVGVYAAYALARRGDRAGVARIVAEAANPDKKARYTAVWLLGQLGARASETEAEALSATVLRQSERGNIRHLAAAALTNLADMAPGSLSDKVVQDMLAAAGTDNLALTRTISKFFPEAASDKVFAGRLKNEPLKSVVTDFVNKNKGAVAMPGALGELVSLLARLVGISLDEPTPAPDPSGKGVKGVDPLLGPLDILIQLPGGRAPKAFWRQGRGDAAAVWAAAGLDAATMARLQVDLRAALPLSGALWVSVPEHTLYAFRVEMERLGLQARLPQARYSAARRDADSATGGLTMDLSQLTDPYIPADADLSLVRVRAGAGASEAALMAALEAVAAAKKERPAVVSLDAVGPVSRARRASALAALAGLLVLHDIGVVSPAGNEGPRPASVTASDNGLGVVVAAAAEALGLQTYSGRGKPGEAPIAWADAVDADGARGTGEAAERSAAKVARLAARLADSFNKAGKPVPAGWFFLVRSAVEQSLQAMPAYGAHEVGGGLFSDEAKAAAVLDAMLADLDGAARRAGDLRAAALRQQDALRQLGSAAQPLVAASKSALQAAFDGPVVDSAARWTKSFLHASFESGQAAPAPSPAAAPAAWWQDRSARRTAVSVPLYALRRGEKDPGIGKLTDLGRYYQETLAPQGVDTVLLLPHFATLEESPYAPVSLYAVSEDLIDWSAVQDASAVPVAPSQSVDYQAVRSREALTAAQAYERFAQEQLAKNTPRAQAFRDFCAKNASWLDEYASFMARRAARFGNAQDAEAIHKYSQWQASLQLKEALDKIHAAGGKALFDIPMFRSKTSVDAAARPEYFTDLATRNPGIENQWVHENWADLALWNWTRLKGEGYKLILDPYRHWLDAGFDGARVDALHFAYKFGNGQKASGDEPGDDFVRALAGVFHERGALPLAEAFEGKAENAKRFGFLTVGGDWKPFSTHDMPRQTGLVPALLDARKQAPSGDNALFAAYTLGDEWADPFPVKEMRDGQSQWRYRIPLPTDPDYKNRVRRDSRPQMRAMDAFAKGNGFSAASDLSTLLAQAAETFIHHDAGGVQIWAASLDWFFEEWGRDTFVSLPGLLLSRGRFEEAKTLIRGFARYEKDGLIPNRIADPAHIEYNTADGSMWFIQAVMKYAQASGDRAFAAEMLPVMTRVVNRYIGGTGYRRYGRFNRVFMDKDGLIVSPAQSTWMDADPEGLDKPVTPRDGKAVEINALWYSNLRFLASLAQGAEKTRLSDLADHVRLSFNEKFWFATDENRKAFGGEGGALRDVAEGDPHGDAIRPNMLFAVSHGADLLSPQRRAAVVQAATRDLLTPYGLRTLSPRDSYYHARYETQKPPLEKDQAYHQGTAWPYLIGTYADALARVRRDQGWTEARIKDEQAALLSPLLAFLASTGEASLPEVFDGGAPIPALQGFSLDDPRGLAAVMPSLVSRQNRGGTRSQAWSVAEVLRIAAERGLIPSK
jgi:glycogen debranching enzyme